MTATDNAALTMALVPVDPASNLKLGWAYLDAAREAEPNQEWAFSHAGYRAMVAVAQRLPAPELSKDHVFRDLVNSLRDTANEYYKTEQLRERMSTALRGHVVPLLADRDQYRRMYDSASGALCAIGEALGVEEDDQSTEASIDAINWLQSRINDLKLELNASESRNAEALELLGPLAEYATDSVSAVMRARAVGARKLIAKQSAPAINEQGAGS